MVNSKRLLAVGTAAFILAGCASGGSGSTQAQLDPSQGPVLTTEDKVKAYNADKATDDKLICSKRPITGSHKKMVICRTVAQARAEQDAAQDTLRRGSGGAQGSVD